MKQMNLEKRVTVINKEWGEIKLSKGEGMKQFIKIQKLGGI